MTSQDENFKALEDFKLNNLEIVAERSGETEEPSALDRLRHLCPSQYFRMYMFLERISHSTCWLPEGYMH